MRQGTARCTARGQSGLISDWDACVRTLQARDVCAQPCRRMSAALRHSRCMVSLSSRVLTQTRFSLRNVASTGHPTSSSRVGIKERTPGSCAGLARIPRYAAHRLLAINARSTDEGSKTTPHAQGSICTWCCTYHRVGMQRIRASVLTDGRRSAGDRVRRT